MKAFTEAHAYVNRLLELPHELERIANRLAIAAEFLRPSAFVCVLVEGRTNLPGIGERRLTCGKSARLTGDVGWVELQTQYHLRHGHVTVLCDLERVWVSGVFIGTAFQHAMLGHCPVATFEEWLPGVLLRVDCHLRR